MRDASSHTAAGITGDDIAVAALQLVRRHGIAGVTMRAIAGELGVRAPSLYHHVASKGQVLDLVARKAFEAFTADPRAYDEVTSIDEWIDVVRTHSIAVLGFYRRHPGLAAAVLAGGDPRPDRPGTRREVDALLRLGVPTDVARPVLDCAARWTVAAVAGYGSPHSGQAREDALFTGGLDLLLAGVRARLVAAVRETPTTTR